MCYTAIFGGTFNPFHVGHYAILSQLCQLDNVDEVWVMPTRVPPHKVCDFLACDEDRIEMCRIACRDFLKAKVCLAEFEREGKSYTIDTVLNLKAKYPERRFMIVCGGDMIASLDTWYRFDLLVKETSFLAFERKGLSKFEKDIERIRALGADVTVLNSNIPDVSSTQLRISLDKELIPESIYDYILNKGIYNAKSST